MHNPIGFNFEFIIEEIPNLIFSGASFIINFFHVTVFLDTPRSKLTFQIFLVFKRTSMILSIAR